MHATTWLLSVVRLDWGFTLKAKLEGALEVPARDGLR